MPALSGTIIWSPLARGGAGYGRCMVGVWPPLAWIYVATAVPSRQIAGRPGLLAAPDPGGSGGAGGEGDGGGGGGKQ